MTNGDVATDKKRRWALWGAVGGAALTLVTAATIAIPLIADMQKSPTTADSIVVDAAGDIDDGVVPDDAEVIGELIDRDASYVPDPMMEVTWRVPVDAPLSTFPPETDYGTCSADQVAWLVEHADTAKFTDYTLNMVIRNAATDGGSMSLDNIRAVGTFEPTPAVVGLTCRAVGGDSAQIATLAVSGEPAVYSEERGAEMGVVYPEGSLVSLNLAPGEMIDFLIELMPRDQTFRGDVVADMLTPSEGTVILGQGVEVRPSPVEDYALTVTDGVLTCQRGAPTEPDGPWAEEWACDPAEAEELLREVAAASG